MGLERPCGSTLQSTKTASAVSIRASALPSSASTAASAATIRAEGGTSVLTSSATASIREGGGRATGIRAADSGRSAAALSDETDGGDRSDRFGEWLEGFSFNSVGDDAGRAAAALRTLADLVQSPRWAMDPVQDEDEDGELSRRRRPMWPSERKACRRQRVGRILQGMCHVIAHDVRSGSGESALECRPRLSHNGVVQALRSATLVCAALSTAAAEDMAEAPAWEDASLDSRRGPSSQGGEGEEGRWGRDRGGEEGLRGRDRGEEVPPARPPRRLTLQHGPGVDALVDAVVHAVAAAGPAYKGGPSTHVVGPVPVGLPADKDAPVGGPVKGITFQLCALRPASLARLVWSVASLRPFTAGGEDFWLPVAEAVAKAAPSMAVVPDLRDLTWATVNGVPWGNGDSMARDRDSDPNGSGKGETGQQGRASSGGGGGDAEGGGIGLRGGGGAALLRDRPPSARELLARAIGAALSAAEPGRIAAAGPEAVSELVGGLPQLGGPPREVTIQRGWVQPGAYLSLAAGLMVHTSPPGGTGAASQDRRYSVDMHHLPSGLLLISRMGPRQLARTLSGFALASFPHEALFDLGAVQAKREMAGFGAAELLTLLWAYSKVGVGGRGSIDGRGGIFEAAAMSTYAEALGLLQ